MATALGSVHDIEQELSSLRVAPDSNQPYQRTSVMTHIAWVPGEWVEAAEDVLAGLAERHPSRTIVLVPDPAAEDGLDASVEVDCYPVGEHRKVSMETIRVKLCGKRVQAPASVVERLIVDRPEWPGLPGRYERLAEIFDRVGVSDIAGAGTSRWRMQLASLW